MRALSMLWLLGLSALTGLAQDLLPQRTNNGILFQYRAPGATNVFLAGDFNEWAHNQGGRITDPAFAMQGPDTNGIWSRTIKLSPGTYHFKFNLNGTPEGWITPAAISEHDADSNAVLRVASSGEVFAATNRDLRWRPRINGHAVLFQFHSPKAHLVYLAGDFNNWGDNHDGLVFDPKFTMQGPDSNGVWRAEVTMPAGHHEYQFVVDGDHWVTDPNALTNAANGHSLLEIK